ncbi:MAG: ATP-binding protein [archaeon]
MLIKRHLFEELKEELDNDKITVLTGSRQVGKTTIMKELNSLTNKKSNYMTFDDPELLNLFEENIKLFIEQYVNTTELLFIDEFQYAKKGGKLLKFIHDTKNTKLFISGSSSSDLTINSLNYLVGRVNLFELYPLTFEEFVNYYDDTKSILLDSIRTHKELSQLNIAFQKYLTYGGYPAVVTSKNSEKELKNLTKIYIMKEIKDVLSFKNIYEYENLVKRLALQDGKLLNKSSISQTIGINRNKIDEMIEILEKTYILYVLIPFLRNKIKEQIKSPKTYFHDLGFKNQLINNYNKLDLRQDKGEIYENFILNQMIRHGFEPKFWNYKNRHEMDFILEKHGNIYGFEIKSKLSNDNITKSIGKFIEYYSPKKIFVLNENIDGKNKYESTEVIHTNHINIIPILKNL